MVFRGEQVSSVRFRLLNAHNCLFIFLKESRVLAGEAFRCDGEDAVCLQAGRQGYGEVERFLGLSGVSGRVAGFRNDDDDECFISGKDGRGEEFVRLLVFQPGHGVADRQVPADMAEVGVDRLDFVVDCPSFLVRRFPVVVPVDCSFGSAGDDGPPGPAAQLLGGAEAFGLAKRRRVDERMNGPRTCTEAGVSDDAGHGFFGRLRLLLSRHSGGDVGVHPEDVGQLAEEGVCGFRPDAAEGL